MAEMTAQHYINRLKNPFDKKPRLLSLWSDEMNQIAALIGQHAAEIAKKDRMIDKACELLSNTGCPGLEDAYCDENCKTAINGGYCWRKWLEKEAEVQG